jgi:hypothetical protein
MDPERQPERELNLQHANCSSETDEEGEKKKRRERTKEMKKKMYHMQARRKRKWLSDAAHSLAMDDSKIITPESEEDSWDDE